MRETSMSMENIRSPLSPKNEREEAWEMVKSLERKCAVSQDTLMRERKSHDEVVQHSFFYCITIIADPVLFGHSCNPLGSK